jgi:pimeloyl-ACP methyl ester carboxylesterase
VTGFVLVHGGWHGGWCWRRVARLLRAAGHEVFTPTLTGLGERSHLLSSAINLDTHIADVVNVIDYEDLEEVVLVGHSYGGMVVTGVADRRPDRLAALVYLDAFVPDDGESLMDLTTEGFRRFLSDGAARHGGLASPPIPAAGFSVGEADREWVDAKCGPHPFATFLQRIALTGAWKTVPLRAYILCDGWSPNPYGPLFERLKADAGWTTATAPCGHDMMIDMPEDLAGRLLGLRERAGARLTQRNSRPGWPLERGSAEVHVTKLVYRIVQHDGGWAYKVGDVLSETFSSHEAALQAAKSAAARQELPGETTEIEFEDAAGAWHEEEAKGTDRPDTDVVDG